MAVSFPVSITKRESDERSNRFFLISTDWRSQPSRLLPVLARRFRFRTLSIHPLLDGDDLNELFSQHAFFPGQIGYFSIRGGYSDWNG